MALDIPGAMAAIICKLFSDLIAGMPLRSWLSPVWR